MRFVADTMTSCLSAGARWSVVRPRSSRSCNVIRVFSDAGESNTVSDGDRRPVSASYLLGQRCCSKSWTHCGKRWRGQGTMRNSWGHDNTKLKICGMKKRMSVLAKWPCMATAEKAMPVK